MTDLIKSAPTKYTVKKNVRTLTGMVTSDKMTKTIVVSIEITVKHPVYGKFMRRNIKLFAHDENEISKLGDRVLIKECRPFSRSKSWILSKVIERAQ